MSRSTLLCFARIWTKCVQETQTMLLFLPWLNEVSVPINMRAVVSSSMSVCRLGFFPVQITERGVQGCCVYVTYGIQHFKASSQHIQFKEWKKLLLNPIRNSFTTCWLLGDSWSTETWPSRRWKSISFQVSGPFICYSWYHSLIQQSCAPPTVQVDEEYPVYKLL